MDDLKLIKRYYGEEMMHLCKKLFPTVLEHQGLLFSILNSKFSHNKFLSSDIIGECLVKDFQCYILGQIKDEKVLVKTNKSPKELLKSVGYDLYEVKNDNDLQNYKKYYRFNEELCSFSEHRCTDHFVFFAIKENALDLKREDFTEPKRQDEYGTSVISIQFTFGKRNVISIKNRYNHSVNNPDATFSNNLENIVPGLTYAFEKKYNFNIKNDVDEDFDIDGYVIGNDGKYYKYNYEINGKYYCINNTIVDEDGKVIKYEMEKYILMDYFLLDLVNKKIELIDKNIIDGFKIEGEIEAISVTKIEDLKRILIKIKNKKDVVLFINKFNKIVSIEDNNTKIVEDNYLFYNEVLENIELKNARLIKSYFLNYNTKLSSINIDKVSIIEDNFLIYNENLKRLYIPRVEHIKDDFLTFNEGLNEIVIPNLESIGKRFLNYNNSLIKINAPSLEYIGPMFMKNNNSLVDFVAPSLLEIDSSFLVKNNSLISITIPRIQKIGGNFLYKNTTLKYYELSNDFEVQIRFLENNKELKEELLNIKSLKIR